MSGESEDWRRRSREPFVSEVIEPALADWSAARFEPESSALRQLRSSARRRLIADARQYKNQWSEFVQQEGHENSSARLLNGDPDQLAIVMTGHQPVIFHSGLVYKYNLTQSFAADHGAIGVSIIIDTDEGDAGGFVFPQCDPGHFETRMLRPLRTLSESFGESSGVFAGNTWRSSSQLNAMISEVGRQLVHAGCESAASGFRAAAERCLKLQHLPLFEASVITRRASGIGSGLLEMPLSVLCAFPEVLGFWEPILQDPEGYARCCNTALEAFRLSENIRNDANPFPNLRIDTDGCELPFWILNCRTWTRRIARANSGDGRVPELLTGEILIPRGPLISATLRLLFSDLFVHGLGGGTYDRFTDQLIQAWWNVAPSPYAVASASRYLFAAERSELQRLRDLESGLRDLQFNPQRAMGTGQFSATVESQLQSLLAEKDAVLRRMNERRMHGETVVEEGRRMQQLTNQVKAIVTEAFGPELNALRNISKETAATVNNRLWPWFFFGRM